MERGPVLWEYRPPRVHPILYALLIACAAVALMGSLENLLRDNRPELYAVYAAPLAAVALGMVVMWRSPVRIHAAGVAPSRMLVARWHRPFIAWDDVEAAYPASYDVTGAFVSPFASSDGKVTQTGLALETRRATETLRFTPTRFSVNARRSRGYREAIDVVRGVFEQRGRPLVPQAVVPSNDDTATMLAAARKPFLPFVAIVLLFASAAPLLWCLAVVVHVPWTWALGICLLPPLGTSLLSWRRSRQRNRILNLLSKAQEYKAGRGVA